MGWYFKLISGLASEKSETISRTRSSSTGLETQPVSRMPSSPPRPHAAKTATAIANVQHAMERVFTTIHPNCDPAYQARSGPWASVSHSFHHHGSRPTQTQRLRIYRFLWFLIRIKNQRNRCLAQPQAFYTVPVFARKIPSNSTIGRIQIDSNDCLDEG